MTRRSWLLVAAAAAGAAASVITVWLPVLPIAVAGIAATVVLAAVAVLPAPSPPGPDPEWLSRRLGRGKSGIQGELRRVIARDVGSLLSLHDLVPVTAEPPVHGEWVADPETLVMLVGAVRALPDNAVVVEIGGGLSTVWMGLAARAEGRGIRIVSLEHDAGFAAATGDAVRRQGLEAHVEVRLGALEPLDVEGAEVLWYPVALLEGIPRVDLLFVDGPPESTGEMARHPAVPLLRDRLTAGARVVLDDTNRSGEKRIVARWLAADGPVRLIRERDLGRTTVLRVAGD